MYWYLIADLPLAELHFLEHSLLFLHLFKALLLPHIGALCLVHFEVLRLAKKYNF